MYVCLCHVSIYEEFHRKTQQAPNPKFLSYSTQKLLDSPIWIWNQFSKKRKIYNFRYEEFKIEFFCKTC